MNDSRDRRGHVTDTPCYAAAQTVDFSEIPVIDLTGIETPEEPSDVWEHGLLPLPGAKLSEASLLALLELQHRLRDEFGGGGGDALSLLGPALSLRCEALITFEKRAAKAPASLSFSIGRSLSFRRKGARKDGKLYVFDPQARWSAYVLLAAAEKEIVDSGLGRRLELKHIDRSGRWWCGGSARRALG